MYVEGVQTLQSFLCNLLWGEISLETKELSNKAELPQLVGIFAMNITERLATGSNVKDSSLWNAGKQLALMTLNTYK